MAWTFDGDKEMLAVFPEDIRTVEPWAGWLCDLTWWDYALIDEEIEAWLKGGHD